MISTPKLLMLVFSVALICCISWRAGRTRCSRRGLAERRGWLILRCRNWFWLSLRWCRTEELQRILDAITRDGVHDHAVGRSMISCSGRSKPVAAIIEAHRRPPASEMQAGFLFRIVRDDVRWPKRSTMACWSTRTM
jgi:hypothetical protein